MAPARKPASKRVFENFDLTETILLHLPLQDLLLSKAVCKDWEKMQNKTSYRIRKALFIIPFSEVKIYYPECSVPHWYLNPKRSELEQAGIIKQGFIVGDDDEDVDDSEPVGHHTNTKASKARPTDNDSPTTPKGKKVMTASDADGDVFSTPKASKAKAASAINADPATTPKAIKKSAESMPCQNLFITPTKLAEDRMMVSRVSDPFINPFLELIFDRFYKGAQGIWRPAVPEDAPNVHPFYAPKMVLCPPVRYEDGTSFGRSRKSRAIQRFTSSWRDMHPFSAVTTSVEVECFDFGQLELTDSHGLRAGKMMELLGEHWSNTCPECSIADYWFGEFVRPLSIFDIYNRGNHGVKKLGLDNTGWQALAKLRAGRVSLVGTKDSVRPY